MRNTVIEKNVNDCQLSFAWVVMGVSMVALSLGVVLK